MLLHFLHHANRSSVCVVCGTVPINDQSIDAAADHVHDLAVNLSLVPGNVADLHVTVIAEPRHEVGNDLRARARIQKCMNILLADICSGRISVGLRHEAVCSACIVGGQCLQRCCGNDLQITGDERGREE